MVTYDISPSDLVAGVLGKMYDCKCVLRVEFLYCYGQIDF